MRGLGLLAIAALLAGSPAWAREVASWDEVEAAAGQVRFEVGCPDEQAGHVNITLSKPGLAYQDDAIRGALLQQAIGEAFASCAVQTADTEGDKEIGDLGLASIYGSPADGAPSQLLYRASWYSRERRTWDLGVDVWAEREKQLAERAQGDRREALAQSSAQTQAIVQQPQADRYAVALENGRQLEARFWADLRKRLWWWGRIGLAAAALLWLLFNWEKLLRWYYSLQPHPATSMVESAIYSGREIDGELYERVLRPVPGSGVEKQVRADQARELTSQLRSHEAALRSEETKRVDQVRRQVEQENAFARAQVELLKAGVDHEVAAARVNELRKAMRDR